MSTANSLALWKNKIESQKHSDLNVKEWCKQNKVSTYTYYYWQRKLEASNQSHKDIFAEILPGAIEGTPAERNNVGVEIMIAWNSVTITVTNQ